MKEETKWSRRALDTRKSKHLLALLEFDLLRVRNEILAETSRDGINRRFDYLAFWSSEFFHYPSRSRRKDLLLLEAYAELAGRGFGAEPIALGVVNGIRRHCSNLPYLRKKTSRMIQSDLVYSARILSQVGYWIVFDSKEPSTLKEVCDCLIDILRIGLSLGLRHFDREIQLNLSRMDEELRKLPPERRASPVSKEHANLVASAFASLEKARKENLPQ